MFSLMSIRRLFFVFVVVAFRSLAFILTGQVRLDRARIARQVQRSALAAANCEQKGDKQRDGISDTHDCQRQVMLL